MKFRRVDLKFPEKGLVVVVGKNLASKGAMQSIGAGKSALGESICHTLLGVSSHFDHVGDYSLDNQGDTYVCLEADFLGKPLKVEMGYKCKELKSGGEALQYTYGDGSPRARPRIEQTRADLVSLLGVPQLLARWSVFVDGDDLKFNRLSQAESVELVMSALRQPPWSEYHERSKKVMGKFRQVLVKDHGAHDESMRRVNEATEDVNDAKDKVLEEQEACQQAQAKNDRIISGYTASIQQRKAALPALQERRAAIVRAVEASARAKAANYHKLEIQANAIRERIRVLEAKKKPLAAEHDELLQAYANADTAYRNYENSGKAKNCPTCLRPMDSRPLNQEHLERLRQKAEAASQTVDARERNYSVLEESLKSQRTLLEANRQEVTALGVEEEMEALRSEDERLEQTLNQGQAEIHRMELALEQAKAAVNDQALNEAKATLRERERVLEQAQASVQRAAAEMAESEALLHVLEYWNTAFSPYGIPNMVLRDAIAPLNREAQRLSTLMTGGTIGITCNTQQELASGLEKAKLVVNVDNKLGSQDIRGNSKGEAGLTNFIIAETLSEVGQVSRRIGFLWLDEILPNQDPVICKSVYSYLRQKAAALGVLIFLVDHNPAAANYADHLLIIEKTGDTERCESKAIWQSSNFLPAASSAPSSS